MNENKNPENQAVETQPTGAATEQSTQVATAAAETPEAPAASQEAVDPIAAARQEKRRIAAKKRRRKKIIKWSVIGVILLAVAAGIWYGVYKLFLEPEPVPPPQTTYSYRGSFSNSISGYGQVKANRTESVTAPVRGELLEILVTEGDIVYEGQELFRLDDTALKEEIQKLEDSKVEYQNNIEKTRETRVKDYESLSEFDKQIADIRAKVAKRNLTAPFNGKLVEMSEALRVGEMLSEGAVLGKIVRDEEMRLKCYFSYAYENDIKLGQTANVSIPASMEVLSGKVTKIDKVRYVTTEGAVLFAVEVTMSNPGALTEGMEAIFTLTAANGDTITPAEQAKLEYSQVETLTAPAKGKVLSLNMTAYAEYKKGDTMYTLSGDEYDSEIDALQENSKSVRERVEGYDKQIKDDEDKIVKADEDIAKLNETFDKLNGAAPMSGMVTAITAVAGQQLEEKAPILAISDTSAMTVEIELDERNVGNVQVGTPVNLTQETSEGEMPYFGTVSSVALEGKYDWGYATYPAVITIENGEGLRANSSMRYEIVMNEAADCVLVPVNAVKYTEIGACVFVKLGEGEKAPSDAPQLAEGVVPEGFYAVLVETGMSDESQVEIKSGIEDGVELYVAEGIAGQEGMDGMYGGGSVVAIG